MSASFYVVDGRSGRRIGHIRQTVAGRWSALSFAALVEPPDRFHVSFAMDEAALGHHLEQATAVRAVVAAFLVRKGTEPGVTRLERSDVSEPRALVQEAF